MSFETAEEIIQELLSDDPQIRDIIDSLDITQELFFSLSPEEHLPLLYQQSISLRPEFRNRLVKFLVTLLKYSEKPIQEEELGDLRLLEFGGIWGGLTKAGQTKFLTDMLTFFDSKLAFHLNPSKVFRENNAHDEDLKSALTELVCSMPAQKQIRFLEFASEEVRLNQQSCCYQIAHRAEFFPGETTRVTVMVIGDAGIGKSTMINESFRSELDTKDRCVEAVGGSSITRNLEPKRCVYQRPVSPKEIANGFPPETILDVEVELIDTPGFTLHEHAKGSMVQLTKDILERISDGYLRPEEMAPVDVVLWAVSGSATRLSDFDELLIRSIGSLVPVGLVWTRALLTENIEQFKSWLTDRSSVRVEIPLCFYHGVYARHERLRGSQIESFGMAELGVSIAGVFNNESRMFRKNFMGKYHDWTETDFAERRANAYSTVKYYSAAAGLIGASPIPYLDNIAVFALQTTMIMRINSQYGASIPKNLVGSMISTIATGGAQWSFSWLALYVVDFGIDSMKLIPGVNLIAMGLSGMIAMGLTAALGSAFINGVEKVVRSYPSLLDVPEDRIEELILEECKEQARLSYQESRKQVVELAGDF